MRIFKKFNGAKSHLFNSISIQMHSPTLANPQNDLSVLQKKGALHRTLFDLNMSKQFRKKMDKMSQLGLKEFSD